MEFLIGLLVLAAFWIVGALLQKGGEGLFDGAEHPVLRGLGVIMIVLGFIIGAVISLAPTVAQNSIPNPYPTYRFTYPHPYPTYPYTYPSYRFSDR
jgi:hypothetical protein